MRDSASGRMVPAIFGMTRRKIKGSAPDRPPGRPYRLRPMASRIPVSTVWSVAGTGFRSAIHRTRSSV